MTTDRYSDDHKIVVGGASGTKEWELQADTIKHSAASNFYISTENAYYTSNSGATFSCNGTKFSYTDESRIDFYQNLIVNSGANIIFGDGSDLKMSDTSKVYGKEFDIWAGVDTSTGTLTISANEGHNPKIVLSQSGNSITETAGLWQVSADTAAITVDTFVGSSSQRSIDLSISSAAFVPCLDDSDADVTSLTLNGVVKHKHNNDFGGTKTSYFAMSLPDSIPNGADIDSLGARIEKAGEGVIITFKFRVKNLTSGSEVDYESADLSAYNLSSSEDGEFYKTDNFSGPIIDRGEKSYTIICKVISSATSSDTVVYIHGIKLTYKTIKLIDNNE